MASSRALDGQVWVSRASAALEALLARASSAAGLSPRALKAGLGSVLACVALHRLLTARRIAPSVGASTAALPPHHAAAPPPAGPAARPRLGRVSVATPAVLFDCPSEAFPGAAVLLPQAAAALRRLATCAGEVFLITQLPAGADAAVAQASAAALEAAGLLGSGSGQVPPHRALVCTTRAGRVALVRQVRTKRAGPGLVLTRVPSAGSGAARGW